MKAAASIVVAGLALALAVLVAGPAGGDSASAQCSTDTNLAGILATIRHHESRGDYTARADRNGQRPNAGSASGAYQFVDGTWNGYGGYTRASDAPADVQDAKAADMVRTILSANANDVTAVPVVWYLGHLPPPGAARWDIVPKPEFGNTLTPRQYQTRWMEFYNTNAGAAAGSDPAVCSVGDGSYDTSIFPQSHSCGNLQWRGYTNGHIPSSALRYRPHSGNLHPQASIDFDALHAAAAAEGIDLSGWGYRNAAGQADVSAGGTGAAVGKSCHGNGIAIDIDVLVPCEPNFQSCGRRQIYRSTAEVFASPEYAWMCANAASYGWINPRWAIPAGRTCTGVVGTGTGGGSARVLEPWHLEAAGVIALHPDFN